MQLFCQILIAFLIVVQLFAGLRQDFEGKPAKPPGGYSGAVATIIAIALVVLLNWKAGSLSLLLP